MEAVADRVPVKSREKTKLNAERKNVRQRLLEIDAALSLGKPNPEKMAQEVAVKFAKMFSKEVPDGDAMFQRRVWSLARGIAIQKSTRGRKPLSEKEKAKRERARHAR